MWTLAIIGSSLVTLAAAQSAVLTFTKVPNPVTDGQPQTIEYKTNNEGTPVTIILRKGPGSNLVTISNLTTTATRGQYVWTPSTSLPNGDDYALQIVQGSETNYFGPFRVQGYVGSASSSSVAVSTALSTASSGPTLPGSSTLTSSTLGTTATVTTSQRTATSSTAASGAANVDHGLGGSVALVAALSMALLH